MDTINNIVKKLRESRLLNERSTYDEYSDEELVNLAQEGDKFAIKVLFSRKEDFLRRMTYKYFVSSNSADEDDIRQTANIAFWEAVQQYTRGEFEAFAGMIIKRRLVDFVRKDTSGKAEINNNADSLNRVTRGEEGESSGGELGDTISAKDTPSAEEDYLGREGAQELMQFMREEFTETERNVIKLYIQGYKMAEIAEVTGLKYKSAENALMRAKNKISEYLRTRESKKIRESKSIEFSEDEKNILMSIINKIDGIEESADVPKRKHK